MKMLVGKMPPVVISYETRGDQEGSRLRMVQVPNDGIGVTTKPMADSS
jgi:hypothetical protein